MSKTERWELLNKNELPRLKSGSSKKINCEASVGMTLIFKNKDTNQIYEIKIIEYLKGYKENGKEVCPKFKVEYTFLKGTQYEEVISKTIQCNSLINGANIGGVILSQNQWRKEKNYWIGVTTKGEEFKFSTDNKEIEYDILHSTWYIHIDGGKSYVMTGKLNNRGKNWKLHQTIAYNGNEKIRQENSNKDMCVDHLNGNSLDNRKENLEIKTKQDNNKNRKTNNKLGLTGLKQSENGKYFSQFVYNSRQIYTTYRESLEEAKIDNLITQRYLGYIHNSELLHLLDNINEARIKEVEDLIEEKKKKIESVLDLGNKKPVYCEELKQIKLSGKEWGEELCLPSNNITACCRGERKSTGGYHFRYATEEEIQQYVTINNITKKDECKEYEYDYIEKDNLIGIRITKKDGGENICWVDKDFGEIREGKYIVNGSINENKKYFNYTINKKMYRIHVYIMTGGITLQNYRNNNFHVDHINHNSNDNYRDNLEITTEYSNQNNKKGKGYYKKETNKYIVQFGYKWKYFDLYIKDTKKYLIVDTIEEAEEIVKRRRDIINKYRFRVKTLEELNEVINFAKEHALDLDSAYIVWKGLDSLENIKNFLKTIDK